MKPKRSTFAVDVQRRYLDAYRVAGTINWFGQATKVVGVVLAIAIFAAFDESKLGVMIALIVVAVCFSIGVMVSAQGQLLRSTLDTAVNSSPFLSDSQKAFTMSLPSTFAETEVEVSIQPDATHPETSDDVASSSFCYHCGYEDVPVGSNTCTSCGKRL